MMTGHVKEQVHLCTFGGLFMWFISWKERLKKRKNTNGKMKDVSGLVHWSSSMRLI